jgi:uroporphyrinogen-III synthase
MNEMEETPSKVLQEKLKGKVIGITRPIERVDEAVGIVEEYGGKALVAPTLELRISNSQSLNNLCKMAGELDWLIFTSPTGIISLFKHCQELKDNLSPNCRIAVIGPRTGNFLEEKGLKADVIAIDYTAEGLLEIFDGIELHNKKIGIPKTMSARDVLPDGLKERGASIFEAEVYRSELPEDKRKVENLINSIITKKIEAVTFTSTLTVQNLFKMVKEEEKEDFFKPLRNGEVLVAAIGPVTAKPLKEQGIPVLMPEEYTVRSMLERLIYEI